MNIDNVNIYFFHKTLFFVEILLKLEAELLNYFKVIKKNIESRYENFSYLFIFVCV